MTEIGRQFVLRLCVMRERVGVRDLRQNLSRYLQRTARGDVFTVTDHNQPVATLGPVSAMDPYWMSLAEFEVQPPGRSTSELPEPLDLGAVDSGKILDDLRAERN
jgi:prevent-host-death family protein